MEVEVGSVFTSCSPSTSFIHFAFSVQWVWLWQGRGQSSNSGVMHGVGTTGVVSSLFWQQHVTSVLVVNI